MPKRTKLTTGVDWIDFQATEADWKRADPKLLVGMLAQIQIIRSFEELVLQVAGAGLIHGPAHSSIGQEAGAVGSIIGLRPTDAVNGSHRGHHQFLAKTLTYLNGHSFDPERLITPETHTLLVKTLSEILGLSNGFSHGRGGSMHLQWLEAGALGTNAVVGGGAPTATGNAFAQKHAGTSDITINYFGDGAAQIGSVLESLNLAAAWKLPAMFFVENNLYAISTAASEVMADTRVSVRGQGFGIPSWRVNGMDPLATYLATQEAADMMRAGGGPAIIEADVYRNFHHNGPFPGSAFGYRSKAEEKEWKQRDPLQMLQTKLLELGHLNEKEIAHIKEQAAATMKAIESEIVEADPDRKGRKRIKPELWPDPEFVDVGIRSDGHELDGLSVKDPSEVPSSHEGKFVEAVAAVMDRRMGQDERIIVLGEDVQHLNGGTDGATKGLVEHHGTDRVLDTPISENGFVGLALGVALDGRFRPVVELMYADFMWVAADQIFNQIGKVRHMFGNNNEVPYVLRARMAMGDGYGSQHSMDPAGIFATAAGWRIVAPSNPAEYVGLMNAALALNDPVLVIENTGLYGSKGAIPEDLDFILPPGKAGIRRTGDDLTVLSYLNMVDMAAEALDQTGISADLIDLRWLDFASLDWGAIEASIKKTNNVVIVEQGARRTAYGNQLASEIQSRFFDYLDQPVQQITGREASPSISKVLEDAANVQLPDVVAGFEQIRKNWGGK
ncbi:MAG: thiamine pyrophosphate-dependent enzyme [Arcanobacterium sp.]|nr:thiamine pyrophosphate-dependent enzyme [Arcanobacterium sp.]